MNPSWNVLNATSSVSAAHYVGGRRVQPLPVILPDQCTNLLQHNNAHSVPDNSGEGSQFNFSTIWEMACRLNSRELAQTQIGRGEIPQPRTWQHKRTRAATQKSRPMGSRRVLHCLTFIRNTFGKPTLIDKVFCGVILHTQMRSVLRHFNGLFSDLWHVDVSHNPWWETAVRPERDMPLFSNSSLPLLGNQRAPRDAHTLLVRHARVRTLHTWLSTQKEKLFKHLGMFPVEMS